MALFFNNLMLDIITKEEDDSEFAIGDSPTLYDATGYGIYVPISPTKCLWFHCQESVISLRSRYLNELQLSTSKYHVVAWKRETLDNISTNRVSLKELEQLNDSYWKCILKTKDSGQCIKSYEKLIMSNIKTYF